MPRIVSALLPACLAAALLACAAPSRAAESYDACAGTITSLPVTIATQGVWCLKSDLSTSMASGEAILVQANNVTIDCNGFKVGGLGAGPATQANGIRSGKTNTTVRNCTVRGFLRGIYLDPAGGGGHLVEDNRLEGNTLTGIRAFGDGTVVRRNQVLDTGGATGFGNTITGIGVGYDADVIDNTVNGVHDTGQAGYAIGISHTGGLSGVIERNRVSNVSRWTSGTEFGIYVGSFNVIVRDNSIIRRLVGATAIECNDGSTSAFANVTTGEGDLLGSCHDAGHNTSATP